MVTDSAMMMQMPRGNSSNFDQQRARRVPCEKLVEIAGVFVPPVRNEATWLSQLRRAQFGLRLWNPELLRSAGTTKQDKAFQRCKSDNGCC